MSVTFKLDVGTKALGRKESPDQRDRKHLMRALVSPHRAIARTSRHWYAPRPLDQGAEPHCVGYAWRHWLSAAPMATRTGPDPVRIYQDAQRVDEWPGEQYDGTSVRAGAKVLESLGHIHEYVWAFDVDTLKAYILERGTCVVGLDWFTGMFETDARGFIKLTGHNEGGHALLAIGYSQNLDAFRLLNSWGSAWGQAGRCWLRYDSMGVLINEMSGEACSAIECNPVTKPVINPKHE